MSWSKRSELSFLSQFLQLTLSAIIHQALANHGYLFVVFLLLSKAVSNPMDSPHHGRNLTLFQLVSKIREVYNMSFLLAIILAIPGIWLCGNIWRLSLSLEDLAKHRDGLEHDGSLAHTDVPPDFLYAPSPPDQTKLKELIDVSSDGKYITFQELVGRRAALDAQLSRPFGFFHSLVAKLETAMLYNVLSMGHAKKDGKVPTEFVRQWVGEERFPEGWKRPEKTIGAFKISWTIYEVWQLMKSVFQTKRTE